MGKQLKVKSMMKSLILSIAAMTTANAISIQDAEPEEEVIALPFLDACPDSVTVSGYSMGGMYSNHLQIVLSDVIKGAGIDAGAPFVKKSKPTVEEIAEHSVKKINS